MSSHTYVSLLLSLTIATQIYHIPSQFGPQILNLRHQLWQRELSCQVQVSSTATSNLILALSSLKLSSKIYTPFSNTVMRRELLRNLTHCQSRRRCSEKNRTKIMRISWSVLIGRLKSWRILGMDSLTKLIPN